MIETLGVITVVVFFLAFFHPKPIGLVVSWVVGAFGILVLWGIGVPGWVFAIIGVLWLLGNIVIVWDEIALAREMKPKVDPRFVFGKNCNSCGEKLMNSAERCPKCGTRQ